MHQVQKNGVLKNETYGVSINMDGLSGSSWKVTRDGDSIVATNKAKEKVYISYAKYGTEAGFYESTKDYIKAEHRTIVESGNYQVVGQKKGTGRHTRSFGNVTADYFSYTDGTSHYMELAAPTKQPDYYVRIYLIGADLASLEDMLPAIRIEA